MTLEHVTIWTEQLEELKDFYTLFFNGIANEKYTNPQTKFQSYFFISDRLEVTTPFVDND